MIVVNILLIIIFSFYLLWNKSSHYLPSPSFVSSLSLQQQVINAAEIASPTVVQIVAEPFSRSYQDSQGISRDSKNLLRKWSGIIWSKKGYILTNNHVVDDLDLKYSIITYDWTLIPVKKIWKDELIDLAVLSIDINQNLTVEAEFLDDQQLIHIWQFSLAIWNPLSEYPNTVSFWIVSGKWRSVDIENNQHSYYAWLYQTDVALNPGNSWWPLVNLSWQVFGMITAISRGGNNIGFALPLNTKLVSTTLNSIEQYGQIFRPYLWITYTDTDIGAYIDTIFLESPLEWLLQVGDIITALDKFPLSLDTPLLYHLYRYKPGDSVIFTIKRKNETHSFSSRS
jgi:serine protease Do